MTKVENTPTVEDTHPIVAMSTDSFRMAHEDRYQWLGSKARLVWLELERKRNVQ